MPRALWSGTISFGLVTIPVRLYKAIAPKELHFHQLHKTDGGRIHFKRFCSIDDKEVPFEGIAKGFPLDKDRYVMVDESELEKFDPRATHSIDIEDFVDMHEIDPIYFESTYYVVPGEGAGRSFSLLVRAMESRGRVAIARIVLRTKEHLCAVRPSHGLLILSTMQYADEIVAPPIEEMPSEAKSKPRELDLAQKLIDSLSVPFKPERYKDRHRERILEFLETKAEGKIWHPPREEHAPEVANLADALAASLQRRKGETAGERRAPREAAARTRRSPSKRPSTASSKRRRPGKT